MTSATSSTPPATTDLVPYTSSDRLTAERVHLRGTCARRIPYFTTILPRLDLLFVLWVELNTQSHSDLVLRHSPRHSDFTQLRLSLRHSGSALPSSPSQTGSDSDLVSSSSYSGSALLTSSQSRYSLLFSSSHTGSVLFLSSWILLIGPRSLARKRDRRSAAIPTQISHV